MRILRQTFGLLIALATLCNFTAAREIYVNNVIGSDLLDGTLASNTDVGRGPYHSIARALKAAEPSDHLIIANTQRPYRESITLEGSRHSGTPYQPFSVESAGAVLDGSQSVPPNAWQHVSGDVFRFQPRKKDFAQVFLDGAPAVRHLASESEDWVNRLEPKQWSLAEGWIYYRVEPHMLPEQYPLTYAVLPVGLTLYKVENVLISGLIIQGFQIDGVNLNDAAGPTVLNGLSCRANGRSGIAVVGDSQVDLHRCTLADNAIAQLLLEGYSTANLSGCQLSDSSAPKWRIHDGAELLINGKLAPR
jgi:hypothetical protein